MITVLQSKDDLADGRQWLRTRGHDFTLPWRLTFWRLLFSIRYRAEAPVTDFMKSWDVARTAQIIEREAPDRNTAILDMGCYNSEILWVLHSMGYRHLFGCDLNPMCRWMPFWNRIRYSQADMAHTSYANHQFGVITCMSTIEHGVAIKPLIQEAGRLLVPKGLLIVTTDFDASDDDHVIPASFRAYNQSWRIFNPAALCEIIGQCQEAGFELLKPDKASLSHDQRPINWNGHDYTFVLIA